MTSNLKSGSWYWIRQKDGSLAPFRFHRAKISDGRQVGEFYVGSMLATFSLGDVVAEANAPEDEAKK